MKYLFYDRGFRSQLDHSANFYYISRICNRNCCLNFRKSVALVCWCLDVLDLSFPLLILSASFPVFRFIVELYSHWSFLFIVLMVAEDWAWLPWRCSDCEEYEWVVNRVSSAQGSFFTTFCELVKSLHSVSAWFIQVTHHPIMAGPQFYQLHVVDCQ